MCLNIFYLYLGVNNMDIKVKQEKDQDNATENKDIVSLLLSFFVFLAIIYIIILFFKLFYIIYYILVLHKNKRYIIHISHLYAI